MKFLLLAYLVASISAAILGLDYGQQFSKAAILAPNIYFEIVLTDEGKRKDLSGICLRNATQGIERIYGSQMGSLVTRFPQSCALDLKQLLGKNISDPTAQQYIKTHPGVKLIGDSKRNGSIKFDLGLGEKNQFSVEELLAMTLQEFKKRAIKLIESTPGQNSPVIDGIVVAIPPFASQATRQAYLDSLYIANIPNVLGLVDEGTSVALDYVTKKLANDDTPKEKKYHLIYDVGAGYTTATVFSLSRNDTALLVEMESFGYDPLFGGRLLTESVYDIIVDKLLSHFNIRSSDLTPKIQARLFEVAEKAKNVLSANMEYQTMIESIYDDKDFKVHVTREEFEEANEVRAEEISKPIEQALAATNLTVDNIQTVVLNGGSSRVPFIQKRIAEIIGEAKISKSVNTDESSVLGTTFRGLDLKTEGKGIKGYTLVEKNYHNYEAKVDDGELISVFPRGSKLGRRKVKLGEVGNSSVVELFEDGNLIKTYKLKDLGSYKLKCTEDQTKELVARFNIDNNKIVTLDTASLVCRDPASQHKDSFFDKLLHKKKSTTEEDDDEIEIKTGNVTNTTATKPTKARKRSPQPIVVPEPEIAGVSSISRVSMFESLKRIDSLNKQDKARAEFENAKNELEGQCYNLRSYIEDKEEVLLKEITDSKISEYNDFVGEVIEWLDFESDDSTIDDILAKAKEIAGKHSEIVDYVRLVTTDLSKSSLEKLYEDGSKFVMSIQSNMMEFGQQINELRQKYQEKAFDFDKENDRLKNKFFKSSDRIMNFDKDMATYREVITEFGNVLNSDIAKYSKNVLFELYDKLSKGVEQMKEDIKYLEDMNKERLEYLEDRFTKLVEREKQRQYRSLLKEYSKSAEEEAKTKTESGSSASEESSSTTESSQESGESSTSSQESSETTSTSQPDVDHDEL
ncbi:uncharacterized protein SPAPADRAFT_50314 [Spathaspora passalidarum NRRL Y-27907]|uniref:Uncharacterized protein n=1 Tax=Spathaspora passalidarum (strain NRRL Y-27907 / 11-Y1) TaxID=619300 RepID=G3AMI9_SPAPN|nr:uncharacterized protein SPAPADRAFT_50314 [Spathaspora passalidarum NRRL Y-27907]EGW33433.1 hypothetical protein SPAPADRAFT_50314 [Spathaspora passalidarum NRRL Y-27907]